MMTQHEKQRQAYESGLELGKRVLSGSGGNRDIAPNGEHYVQEAAATARFLGVGKEELVATIQQFHAQRIEAAPDPARYPEARGERDILMEKYRGMRDAGLSDALIALAESMSFWQKYKMPELYGKIYNPVVVNELRERCRIVYLPESDQGPIHFKNVDNPLATWTPRPPEKQGQRWPYSPLMFDGTGSGLHVDEPAKEIFPLDVKRLCQEHCATVDQATEFLVRYNYFWGGGNQLIHDDHGQSVAVDKASRNRIAVRKPDSSGISYINGMSSFDPDYQAFMDRQRNRYLRETGQGDESVEACYFRFCNKVLENMKAYMEQLKETPTLARVVQVMTSRDPSGALCKYGARVHPDEQNPNYTLIQRLFFLRSRLLFRRQWRGKTPVWEDYWEPIQYV